MVARFFTARRLYARGMVAWCEKEHLYIIDHSPPESPEAAKSKSILAELFHDQERDGEAAEMLQKLVDQLKKNVEFAQKMTEWEMRPGLIRSQLHYYLACQAGAKSDWKDQLDELDEAIDKGDPADPDPDVLIALYHIPNQDAGSRPSKRQQVDSSSDSIVQESAWRANPIPNALGLATTNTPGSSPIRRATSIGPSIIRRNRSRWRPAKANCLTRWRTATPRRRTTKTPSRIKPAPSNWTPVPPRFADRWTNSASSAIKRKRQRRDLPPRACRATAAAVAR